jgi:hypothetical protein
MRERSFTPLALLLGLGAFTSAYADPVNVAPGDTDIPVPLYSSSGTPTVTVLADTGLQSATSNGLTVQFEELAVRTSLDPGGVSFAFALAASNAPSSFGASLPGFGGFTTAVESCDPFALGGGPAVCGMQSGTASRSAGSGDLLSFAAIGTSPVSMPPIGTTNLSNVYGIFTNAPGFIDPTVTVTDDGTSFTFDGIAPSGATSVPEPATLALLGLALLALVALHRGRAWRAGRQA